MGDASMFYRPPQDTTPATQEESAKWLALLIRQGLLLIVAGIERRYGLRK